MPEGSLHTVPEAQDHAEVQVYPSCTAQGSNRARRCHPRSLVGSPRPLCKTTVGPQSPPPSRQEYQCPPPGLLPAALAQPAALGWCDPALVPHLHPPTRPESRLQSPGSSCGACHPLTAGAEQSQRRSALCRAAPHGPLLTPGLGCTRAASAASEATAAALSGPSPGCSQPQPSSTGSWSPSPGAHRDVSFLCDDLEHVCDGNVAKPLCNGQGSSAVLCREEGLGSAAAMGKPGQAPKLAMGQRGAGKGHTHCADLVGRGTMLQQQCHHVRVSLLCRLVQRGVTQLRGRTEGAAISSGSLLPQKCPWASHHASCLEHEGSSLLSGVSKGLCRTQHLPRAVARHRLPAMETGGLGVMWGDERGSGEGG